MSLMAIVCLAKMTPCHHQLLEDGVLDVLIKAMNPYLVTSPILEKFATTKLLCNSLYVPTSRMSLKGLQ